MLPDLSPSRIVRFVADLHGVVYRRLRMG